MDGKTPKRDSKKFRKGTTKKNESKLGKQGNSAPRQPLFPPDIKATLRALRRKKKLEGNGE